MKRRRKNPDVSPEAWELVLFGENSSDHWIRNQFDSIVKNITRKVNKGTYDAARAPALWKYWFDSIAKQYTKEHGTGGGYGIFTATVRREAADYYAPLMYQDIIAGEYDHLLKVKRNPTRRRTMTRKKRRTTARTPAQMRATRAMLAANRKRRGTRKKVARRNPAYGNFQTARAALRNPVRPLRGQKLSPMYHYGIKNGTRWFDGKGWTADKKKAASWRTLNAAKTIAHALADVTGKSLSIHSV